MLYDSYFYNPKDVPLLLDKIRIYSDKTGPARLMEICGTHTMAIARSGIRSVLPENVQLLSASLRSRLSGLCYTCQHDRYGS